MERNHNEQQIVMSIEHYRNLLGMADRSKYITTNIERHVRKHNPFLQPEHQAKVRERESRRSKHIREARGLVDNYHGKLVYAATRVNQHREDAALQGLVYTTVRVQCINNKNRQLVDVYKPEHTKPHWATRQSITADQVIYEIPDGYVQLLGPGAYTNMLVKEWSPIHWYHLQELAQRENHERDEYYAKIAKNAEAKISGDPEARVSVAYDVIGDR